LLLATAVQPQQQAVEKVHALGCSSILGDTRVFLDGQISDQHVRRGAFERKSGHRHLDFMPARIIGEVNARGHGQNRIGLARRCLCSAPGRAVCRRRRSPRGDCRQERLWRSGHFSCLAAFAHSPPNMGPSRLNVVRNRLPLRTVRPSPWKRWPRLGRMTCNLCTPFFKQTPRPRRHGRRRPGSRPQVSPQLPLADTVGW